MYFKILLLLSAVSLFSAQFLIEKSENTSQIESNSQPIKIDPDYTKTIEQIIISRGYPLETHYATTTDGYILKLFRIPYGKNSTSTKPNPKPILFAHGFLDSADSFIIHHEDKSYTYVLANLGYDIWIMNSRGNKHSRSHVKFNPDKDNDFWEFTFHEMAAYDVPAVIKHIKTHTGVSKITYVGHSQGTLQVFAGNTLDPNFFRDNVNGVIALGPVTSLANIGSSFIALAAKTRLDTVLYYMGMRELLPSVKSLNEMISILCDKLHIVCDGVLELIADGNADDDDQDKFQVFLSKFPSGTSVKDLSHFAQYVRSGKFAQFDYGKAENQKRYGRDTPPEYEIAKIQNKICLFVGTDDKLATLADNRIFKQQLEKIGKLTLYQEIPKTGHLTFFVPKDFSYFQNIRKCISDFEK